MVARDARKRKPPDPGAERASRFGPPDGFAPLTRSTPGRPESSLFPATISAMRHMLVGLFVLLIGMAGVVLYTGVARDREYRRLVAVGDQALVDEQSFGAIEAYSGAIALNRDPMLAYLKRGETYRQLGDLPAALRDLSMAARLDPTATRPLEQLGDARYALEQYDVAADHYDQYLKLDDQNPLVLYKLSLANHREGRTSRALGLLERAIELDPRFAEAHYLLGLALRELDRAEDARSALEQAVTLSPGFLKAREALADVYRIVGDTRNALQQLDALAALDQDRPDRHITRGRAYARAGRTDLAVVALGRAAEEQTDLPQVYQALGEVWLDVAESRNDHVALSKALEALQSIPLATASSEALTLLGRSLRLDGDLDGARRALRLAIDRYPVDADAFLVLAELEDRDLNDDAASRLRQQYARLTGTEPEPTTWSGAGLRPAL